MSCPSLVTGRSGGMAALGPILLALGLLCGCTGVSQSDTYAVSGAITHQGKPVPRGNISFAPDSSQGNQGPGTTAEIKDGKYQTPEGKGVVGGPYVLTVQGFDGVPIPSGEGGMDEAGKPLFKPYEMKVDLPKADATQDIDVP